MMGTVRNNTAASRYELEVDGVVAFVTYHAEGPVISLDHTEVPPAIGGKGVGSALAKGIFDLLRSEGRKIIPKCRFLASFIARHPEYQDLVAGK